MLPNTEDPLERGRFAANSENDYRIDRERQRTSNFSGIEDSPPLQDAAVQESMGPIVDRSGEHLVASDEGVIRVRRRLLGRGPPSPPTFGEGSLPGSALRAPTGYAASR